jgi:hypothetical protein
MGKGWEGFDNNTIAALSWHFAGVTEDNHTNVSQDDWCHDRGSNWASQVQLTRFTALLYTLVLCRQAFIYFFIIYFSVVSAGVYLLLYYIV